MRGLVEYDVPNGFGKRVETIEHGVQFKPVYDHSIPETIRPITIQINVGRDDKATEKRPFSLFRSKIVWFLLTLAISFGLSYARARTVCQGFKDTGKFYYGMDVSRCVGVLIKEPLATVEEQLSTLNGRY